MSFVHPTEYGYSEAVVFTAGRVKCVYTSGQVGSGDGGLLDVPTDFSAQAENAFRNLVRQLEASGASPDDVVKIDAYIKDMDVDKGMALEGVKQKYFTNQVQPASTWVGVTSLLTPEIPVEIEAIAVVAE